MLLQWVRLYCYSSHDINIQTAIDPANKLNFYRDDHQEFNQAKKVFLKAVSYYLLEIYDALIQVGQSFNLMWFQLVPHRDKLLDL